MNDVEPRAEIRSRVFRLSSKLATKTKVTSGHHPGKGVRACQAPSAVKTAPEAMAKTNRCVFVSRDINGKVMGAPVGVRSYCQVEPSLLLNKPARKKPADASQLIFNMSVTPVMRTY